VILSVSFGGGKVFLIFCSFFQCLFTQKGDESCLRIFERQRILQGSALLPQEYPCSKNDLSYLKVFQVKLDYVCFVGGAFSNALC